MIKDNGWISVTLDGVSCKRDAYFVTNSQIKDFKTAKWFVEDESKIATKDAKTFVMRSQV